MAWRQCQRVLFTGDYAGALMYQAALRAYGLKATAAKFGHHTIHDLPDGNKL